MNSLKSAHQNLYIYYLIFYQVNRLDNTLFVIDISIASSIVNFFCIVNGKLKKQFRIESMSIKSYILDFFAKQNGAREKN